MNAFQRKLNSGRGASMLIALVYFLAALILGAVALTAASANAGRAGRNVKDQQAYYAVSSAAELVKDDMAGAGFSKSAYKTTKELWEKDGFKDKIVNDSSSFDVKPEGKLLYALKSELRSFYSTPYAVGVGEKKDIPLNFSAGENMQAVDGVMTLYRGGGRDYYIEIQLFLTDSGERVGLTTLSYAPFVENVDNTEESISDNIHTTVETKTTAVSWGVPEVTKG